jgi:hypothetical protein
VVALVGRPGARARLIATRSRARLIATPVPALVGQSGRVPRRTWFAAGALVALVLAACAPSAGAGRTESGPTATPATTAPTSGPDATPTTSAAPAVTADDVRARAEPDPRIGGLHAWVTGGLDAVPDPDGERWTLSRSADTPDGDVLLRLATPEGATFEVLGDRSVLVAPVPGVTDGVGIAPLPAGTVEASGDLLVVRAHPAAPDEPVVVWFGRTALAGATWGEREGGRSLAVVPTPWARAAGEAGTAMVWRALGDLGPEAVGPGMWEQLACHAIGAPDKESWNLEPWRPDVGLLETLLAECNP